MLLGFQFRILLILREMQTKSTPPPPFFGKKQRNIFFQQNTSSFKIYPIRLCLQVQYVCKCYF